MLPLLLDPPVSDQYIYGPINTSQGRLTQSKVHLSSPQVPTSLITSSCYTYFNSTIYVYIFLLNYKRCSFFPGHLALLGMFNNILYWAPFSPSSSPRLLLFSMSLWGKPDFTGIQLGIYRINLGRREWLLHRWLVESWKMCTTQTCCFPNLDFQNLYVNWF